MCAAAVMSSRRKTRKVCFVNLSLNNCLASSGSSTGAFSRTLSSGTSPKTASTETSSTETLAKTSLSGTSALASLARNLPSIGSLIGNTSGMISSTETSEHLGKANRTTLQTKLSTSGISKRESKLFKKKAKKSFECKMCYKSFSQKQHVKFHLTTVHEKTKPYKCIVCSKTFKRKDHLKRHLFNVHEKLKLFY